MEAFAMASAKRDKGKPSDSELLVCRNPKAEHDYDIEERLEAGIALMGSEVKSLRARQANLEGAYASVDRGELFLHGMHIAPYAQATTFGHEAKRSRKLLVHKREIMRLIGQLGERGYTLVPLSVYFKAGRAKVALGLGKGKSRGDKRETLRRDIDLREARDAIGRAMKRS
jgi:SsrA-binding protein